jgi:hypothetical protein
LSSFHQTYASRIYQGIKEANPYYFEKEEKIAEAFKLINSDDKKPEIDINGIKIILQ